MELMVDRLAERLVRVVDKSDRERLGDFARGRHDLVAKEPRRVVIVPPACVRHLLFDGTQDIGRRLAENAGRFERLFLSLVVELSPEEYAIERLSCAHFSPPLPIILRELTVYAIENLCRFVGQFVKNV